MWKNGFVFLVFTVVQAVSLKIPAGLEETLKTVGNADIFISLESTHQILSQLKSATFHSRDERKAFVAHALKNHAVQSQKSVLKFLSKTNKITVKSFWISNEIYIKNVDLTLVKKLVQRSDILAIREENKKPKVLPAVLSYPSAHVKGQLAWGLEKIDVQPVWDQGINGTDVRVGILDTGVLVTHEALRDNYVGEYGWFAPIHESPLPEDWDGHGTHVMGILVGQGGIGVAPGAKWMACKNVPGYEAEDIECGQWMLCPTLSDGSNPDCTKGADLVSNSWGHDGGNPFFEPVLSAWEVANIVPIFAAGNSGPACSTLVSPADSAHPAAITIGATDVNDKIASFSSFGPSTFGSVTKPDIAAPGSDITSACIGSDSNYCAMSGTSMAAPHAAGVVALVLSANPTYSIEDVARTLYLGATHTVGVTGRNCGGIPETTYPNNHVGHGRLSASGSLIQP